MGKPIKAGGILRDFSDEPEYFTAGLESGSRVLEAGINQLLLQAATADCLHNFDMILIFQGNAGEITARNNLLIKLYRQPFIAQRQRFQ